MQTVRVRTTQNVFIDYPLASIGDRIVAYLIDGVILTVYSVAIAALLFSIDFDGWLVYILLIGLPWFFYSLLFEVFMDGQTPGKRVMKAKVVRLDGTLPTLGNYLFRWLFIYFDFYFLTGVVAILAIAIGGKGQRLGDMVAGTSVVKLIKQREVTAEEVFTTASEMHVPTFTQVTELSDYDIELIQRALDANRDQGNTLPVNVLTEKIKTMLKIQSDLPPAQFLEIIIKDYNTLTAGR